MWTALVKKTVPLAINLLDYPPFTRYDVIVSIRVFVGLYICGAYSGIPINCATESMTQACSGIYQFPCA